MTAWKNRLQWVKYSCRVNTAALVLLACYAFVWLSPAAHAGSVGHIYGQLLDGSNKNVPLAGQRVTLQMAQGKDAKDLSNATTDGQGSFSFGGLSTDKTISYAVYTRYQGAQYTSAIISLDTKAAQHVKLVVYEATTSMANIAIVRATILLRSPDRQKGIVPVSELFIFRNLDARTYVGSLDASHGKPNALRFSLPHTARNISLGKGFDGYTAIQVDSGFASNAAIPPGDSQFSFTFDMSYTTSSYDFNYTVVYPTVLLAYLVPPEIQASSDTLTSQGPVTSQQQGYKLLQAKALLANKEVHVQLDGLPSLPVVASSPTPTGSQPGVPWLVIVLLVMAAILSITGVVYRSLHRRALPVTSKKGSKGKKRPKQQVASKQKVAPVKVEQKAKEGENALLQELLELDKTYEAGKMKKAAYQERRARIKAQLRALMGEKVAP
jgi:hypothetical protein